MSLDTRADGYDTCVYCGGDAFVWGHCPAMFARYKVKAAHMAPGEIRDRARDRKRAEKADARDRHKKAIKDRPRIGERRP